MIDQELLEAVTRLNRAIIEFELIGAWGLAKVLRAEVLALLKLIQERRTE